VSDKNDELEGNESGRWAADEPTAMWDDSALNDAGFAELMKDRQERPREATGPATNRAAGGSSEAGKIEVTGTHPQPSAPRPASAPQRSGPSALSWALTVALAIGIGVVVFFVVRALR
jgi:hypothetical protein